MIVAIAALISLLFLGGVNEAFLIEKFEKGVKEYVVEKDRRKEIQEDIKTTKKHIKNFNKQRKKQYASFQKMYKDETSSEQNFYAFYELLEKERLDLQNTIIDERLAIIDKIDKDEWDAILGLSGEKHDKAQAKVLKKIEKKGPAVLFPKTRKAINDVSSDENQKTTLNAGLDALVAELEDLGAKINAVNVRENEILINKDADKTMLKSVKKEMNSMRKATFEQMVDFHSLLTENTSTEQWNKIVKAFTKEMEMSEK